MIGYSLSFCVSDICRGVVSLASVEKIITSTCASNDDEWNKLISRYSEVYWRSYPNLAIFIANKLRDEGKIEQPLLTNPNYERYIGTDFNGRWETSE